VINDGTLGTLAGLDSTTTIEPMPSEYASLEFIGNVVASSLEVAEASASLVITRESTDAITEADILGVSGIAFYEENEVYPDII